MSMAHTVVTVPARAVMDGGASALILASLVQWLPPIAAVVGMIYYILLILDNRRFIQFINFLTHFKMFKMKVPRIVPTASFRLHLIDEWRTMWRWFSCRLIAVAALLQGAVLTFPAALSPYLPPPLMMWITIGLLAAAVLSQAVKQPKIEGHRNEPDKPVQS